MLSLGQIILASILKLIGMILLQGPLLLLNIVSQGIQFVTGGLQGNLFFKANGKFQNGMYYPPDLSKLHTPGPFIGFCIVAVTIGLCIFIGKLISIYTKPSAQAAEHKQKILQAFKMAIFAGGTMILIPLFFFATTVLITGLSGMTTTIFTTVTGTKLSLADQMYTIGYVPSNYNDASGSIPVFPETIPKLFGPPSSKVILQYNWLIEILAVYFALLCGVIICGMVITKTIEMLILFIISPIIAATMPYDDGKKMNVWKDLAISKAGLIVANYIGYGVFLYSLKYGMMMIFQNPSLSGFLKAFLTVLFIFGLLAAILGLSPMIASLFGEGMGIREGLSQLTAMTAGGMLGKVGGRMFGKMKGWWNKKRSNSGKDDDSGKDDSGGSGGPGGGKDDDNKGGPSGPKGMPNDRLAENLKKAGDKGSFFARNLAKMGAYAKYAAGGVGSWIKNGFGFAKNAFVGKDRLKDFEEMKTKKVYDNLKSKNPIKKANATNKVKQGKEDAFNGSLNAKKYLNKLNEYDEIEKTRQAKIQEEERIKRKVQDLKEEEIARQRYESSKQNS